MTSGIGSAIALHTNKIVNTAGAVPGVGTGVGIGRMALGAILGIIAVIGRLLSSCAKGDMGKAFIPNIYLALSNVPVDSKT